MDDEVTWEDIAEIERKVAKAERDVWPTFVINLPAIVSRVDYPELFIRIEDDQSKD